MKSSSRGAGIGAEGYSRRHNTSHPSPKTPVTTNAGLQLPDTEYNQITITGAMAPPTAEPLSNMATARPRSDFGNHSETAFVAPGQLAASPAPSRNRNAAKLARPVAREVAMATAEYQSTANDNPRLVPSRSSSFPETG